MRYPAGLMMALVLLAGCATVHRFTPGVSAPPRSATPRYLDKETGDSTLVVARPLVFARERSDVAAHERDYATVVAVETSNGGKISQFLLVYRWSTVDPRMSAPPDPAAGQLRVLAEARTIDFVPLDPMPFTLAHRKELHLPRKAQVVAWAYPVDLATLRFIAQSSTLRLRMPQDRLDAPFALWEDGRTALKDFLAQIGSP